MSTYTINHSLYCSTFSFELKNFLMNAWKIGKLVTHLSKHNLQFTKSRPDNRRPFFNIQSNKEPFFDL